MSMTWETLGQFIADMPKDRKQDDATVFLRIRGEVFKIEDFSTIEDIDEQGDASDALDDGHYVVSADA